MSACGLLDPLFGRRRPMQEVIHKQVFDCKRSMLRCLLGQIRIQYACKCVSALDRS